MLVKDSNALNKASLYLYINKLAGSSINNSVILNLNGQALSIPMVKYSAYTKNSLLL